MYSPQCSDEESTDYSDSDKEDEPDITEGSSAELAKDVPQYRI